MQPRRYFRKHDQAVGLCRASIATFTSLLRLCRSIVGSVKTVSSEDDSANLIGHDRDLWSGYLGTYSAGLADPAPNRNFSISATRNARALGSIGVRRFSLINMV